MQEITPIFNDPYLRFQRAAPTQDIKTPKPPTWEAPAVMKTLADIPEAIETPKVSVAKLPPAEAIDRYLLAKNNPNPKVQEAAVDGLFNLIRSPDMATFRNYALAGILSMFYDKSVAIQLLQLAAARLTGGMLTDFLVEGDFFFAISIMRSIMERVQDMDATSQMAVLRMLNTLKLEAHPNLQIRYNAGLILEKLGLLNESPHDAIDLPNHAPEAAGKIAQGQPLGIGIANVIAPGIRMVDRKGIPMMEFVVGGLMISATIYNGTIVPRTLSWAGLLIFIDGLQPVDALDTMYPLTPDLGRIAIVTSSLANLPHELLDYPFVRAVTFDPSAPTDAYYNLYRRLTDQGYGTIFVLMPEGRLWKEHHYAFESSHPFDQYVKVIDTHTVGLGLSVMVRLAVQYVLLHKSRKSIDTAIRNDRKRLRHWVILAGAHPVQTATWFKKMVVERVEQRMWIKSGFPILSMSEPARIVGSEKTLDGAANFVILAIRAHFDSMHEVPEKIIIQSADLVENAEWITDQLHQCYPHIEVAYSDATTGMQDLLGRHISLAAI